MSAKHFAHINNSYASVGSVKERRALELIKWLAMILLVVDHVTLFLLGNHWIGRFLGRIAFPLFAYMIAVGMQYSSNTNKYLLRIIGFAIVSEIPFDLALSGYPIYFDSQNVLWTFALAIAAKCIANKFDGSLIAWIFVIPLAILLGNLLQTDYGSMGVATTLVFHLGMFGFSKSKENPSPVRVHVVQILALLLLVGWHVSRQAIIEHPNLFFEVPALLAIPILFLSSGARASISKTRKRVTKLWYLVYPVHFMVIVAILFWQGTYTFTGWIG